MGSDAAAVAFDACEAAVARGADFLILDTAGRLHTQKDLMRQLTKIRDVVARKIADAPNEVLLVLDATTGPLQGYSWRNSTVRRGAESLSLSRTSLIYR
jgi:signal recognition particle GTPase